MSKKLLVSLLAAAFLGVGAAFAVAGADTTGTVTACATASVPDRTVNDSTGKAALILPGTSASSCQTVTYTVPTTTATTTLSTTATSTVPAATTTTTATTTTAATASGQVVFDGRAAQMTALDSYEKDGTLNTLTQTQSPAVWDCLCYADHDITLQPDPAFGQVYQAVVEYPDKNPWNAAPTPGTASAQLSKGRPNDLGKTDYFAVAVKLASSWANPDWASLVSLEYETLAWDQLSLVVYPVAGAPTLELYQNAGKVNCPSTTCAGTVSGATKIATLKPGQWLEIVVAVKWATDNTGFVTVYTRTPGGQWAKTVDRQNLPTALYGTTSYGTVDADLNQNGAPISVLDKLGLYYGYWNSTSTSFPQETAYESGLVRASDLATAENSLP